MVTGTAASATHAAQVALTVTLPDDFSIGVTPAGVSVPQGQSATATVSTAVVSGNPQTVTLSAANVPAGASVAFNPSSLLAGTSSIMTITTTTTAAPGTFAMTVVGTAASVTHTTPLSLTVTPPSSAPRLVQSTGASETASATTLSASFANPTGAGDLLVLEASVYSGATNQIVRVTDQAGNAWTRVGAYCTAGHYSDGELWYAANAGSVTSVTATLATAASMALQVQEFSGLAAASPLDVSHGASNTGTAADSGAVTPSTANAVAVGFVTGHGSVQTITIGPAGYTSQPQQTSTNAGATPVSVVSAYRILSATDAQDIAGSYPSAMYWAAGIAVFKAA